MPVKRKNLISGAEYWDFTQEPKFCGYFASEHYNDQGKLIGYDFFDQQGEPWIISNSHSIDKAIEMTGRDSGKLLEIIFKGKIIVKSSGKPFNKFEVNLLEDDDDIQPEPQQEEPSKPSKSKK